MAPSSVQAEDRPSIEYKVKASYLYNFLQFVEWPADAFTGNTLLVCVLGTDNFGAALRQISGEVVRGRTVALRYFQDIQGLQNCHVVFVSASSENNRDSQVLQYLSRRPILIIGESSGFIQRGGIINLVRVDGKIRFEINQQAATRNRLKISAQLLQLGLRHD